MRTSRAVRRLRLVGLSLFVLACCLCSQLVSTRLTHALGGLAPAYANTAAQQVEQGAAAYRNHRYSDAIENWRSALSQYGDRENSAENSLERAIILENLARAYQQQGQLALALEHWQLATDVYVARQNGAKIGRTLAAQAAAYRQLGQPYQAAGILCRPVTDEVDYEVYGPQFCRPESAIAQSRQAADRAGEIAALGSLGETYRVIQRYELAVQVLEAGLEMSRNLAGNSALAEGVSRAQQRAPLHNSLGNVHKEQAELGYQQAIAAQRGLTGGEQDLRAAAERYRQAAIAQFIQSETLARNSDDAATEVKALLGRLAVSFQSNKLESTASLREQAIARLGQLPPNQAQVYLALQLTKRPRELGVAGSSRASRSQCTDIFLDDRTRSLLQQAHTLATRLNNNRLVAFSQGEIGHYYECTGDYSSALQWTQQARLAASGDRVLALDTLYLWQWQTGRIYQHQGQTDQAIEYYAKAVGNLDRVREEILSSDRNLQFDFRDAVAPVYRELAEIRLTQVSSAESASSLEHTNLANKSNSQTSNQNIRAALGDIDSLQLAELQNYFGSDCLVPVADLRLDDLLSSTEARTSTVSDAALINTVIFPDRTAAILTLPGQAPLLHWIDQPEEYLRQSVITLRNSLEDTANELEGFDTTGAERLYSQIIAPFLPMLSQNDIKTLVFVNDGILRNIPMGALYDGQQYLVEQYALALAPSLQRSDASPRGSLPSRALILGLSQNPTVNGQQLGSLPAVRREVQEVLSVFPNSDLLLDAAFTKTNLEQNLSDRTYPVLHIATHGKFDTAPNKTFLVTGDKAGNQETGAGENQLLRLGELDTLVRGGATPTASAPTDLLDLIVLSACETATGDERASLGLAGVTIRAGARTALASLWSVDDESTADLVTYFYQNWDSGLSKSEALRQAQIAVMKDPKYFQHPAYWSAFMLVGDWQ